jgi:hypothetical protein
MMCDLFLKFIDSDFFSLLISDEKKLFFELLPVMDDIMQSHLAKKMLVVDNVKFLICFFLEAILCF